MYRTFLTRETLPLFRGHYAEQVLEVPTQVLVGDRDLITRSVAAGPFPGQPNVTVQRVDGVGHFLLEEAPEVVIDALRRS
jgi:pimeloyl-ACP methyl ester carboxylesterase